MAALVLCGAYRADHVMLAGKWVVEAGEIPGLDLPDWMAAHRRLAGDLLKQGIVIQIRIRPPRDLIHS